MCISIGDWSVQPSSSFQVFEGSHIPVHLKPLLSVWDLRFSRRRVWDRACCFSTLKMEAIRSSEFSINFYQTSGPNIPEDSAVLPEFYLGFSKSNGVAIRNYTKVVLQVNGSPRRFWYCSGNICRMGHLEGRRVHGRMTFGLILRI
jgi:hypothetical protein